MNDDVSHHFKRRWKKNVANSGSGLGKKKVPTEWDF